MYPCGFCVYNNRCMYFYNSIVIGVCMLHERWIRLALARGRGVDGEMYMYSGTSIVILWTLFVLEYMKCPDSRGVLISEVALCASLCTWDNAAMFNN